MSTHKINLDLEGFKPEAKKADPVAKASIEQIAVESGFKTRHAPGHLTKKPAASGSASYVASPSISSTTEGEGEARRRGRKRTTNRNTPFTVKLKIETNNLIYDLADQLECTAIAEVLELALSALQDEIDSGIDPRVRAAKQISK